MTDEPLILNRANVSDYLEARGLIKPEIDKPRAWLVNEYSSRNRNFAVAHPQSRRGFFVKQLKVLAPASVVMMQREATIYWLARHDGDFEALKKITPDLLLFDGAIKVIVLRLVPESENLLSNQERLGSYSIDAAASLGDALAIIHGKVGLKMRSDPVREAFPLEPPGIFTAHRNGPLNQWLGQGQRRLIEIVRDHNTLSDCLDSLASSWGFDSFIHGDVKFENCVRSRFASSGKGEVKIVDWELADFGDPCWDVGSLVQSYLYHCIRPSLAQRGLSLEARFERASHQTESMRASIARFWECYFAGMSLDEGQRRGFLERVIYCVSARMIQMALEVMHGHPEPPPAALSLLDASAEIITRPDAAASQSGFPSAWQPFGLPASPTRGE